MRANTGAKKKSAKVVKLKRPRSKEVIDKATQTLAERRKEERQPVTVTLTQRTAAHLRAALGSDLSPARAAMGLRVGERLIWETSAREFGAEFTRLKLREPLAKKMRFETKDATTFINASLAFETCVIRRVE